MLQARSTGPTTKAVRACYPALCEVLAIRSQRIKDQPLCGGCRRLGAAVDRCSRDQKDGARPKVIRSPFER